VSGKRKTLKESREGRLCPKCKDYNMDEEGYCSYCGQKTGTSRT
jgi:rRNA maturation protein Nop10